jgi:3-phenylpropionate/trans-cinnamate dioxygenase ferredoxin reductase subunit
VAAEHRVVIVGAGHAGAQLAITLAKAEHPARVTLLGDETVLPYERPALSKRLLYSPDEPHPVLLRTAEYWQRSAVDLRAGQRVVAVDAAARLVRTAAGATVAYDTLVWAAGGRAASPGLPGEELAGVHSIRDFADLVAVRQSLRCARNAVVVGGGYLGLEAAAGLRGLGVAVTIVETAPRLLARVAGDVVSTFFAALHRDHGVDVRLGVGVDGIVGADGRVTGVSLADGTVLAADVVVVGVGLRPCVAPLAEAGACVDRLGIVVDAECRTDLPDVFAIGDCVSQLNPWSAATSGIRVESVHNAAQHAAVVARTLAGLPALDPAPPRFWSTQYGVELRTVGLASPADETVLRGDPSTSEFAVASLREGRLIALDTVNRPRDFARAQALIATGWRPENPGGLADPALDLPRASLAVARAVEV